MAQGHSFEDWLLHVDSALSDLTDSEVFNHQDLADFTWRDAYDNGDTPHNAARDALLENDYEFSEEDGDDDLDDGFEFFDEDGE